MFTVSSAFETVLRGRHRKPLYVYELYDTNYIPFEHGDNLSFDPRDALALFSGQSLSFTLDGDTVTYRREVTQGPDIQKSKEKKFDTVSITFSNVSRYMAAFVLNNKVHGMQLVVRLMMRTIALSPSTAPLLGDSIVVFVGKVDKPDGFNRSKGVLSATQDLGTIEAQIPPTQYQTPCPLKFKEPGGDCLGNQTLAEKSPTYRAAVLCNKTEAQCVDYGNEKYRQGINVVQLTSSFIYRPHRGLFTRIINIAVPLSIPIYNALRRRTTVGNSIHDGTPTGQPRPVILGRWQKKLTALQYQDAGETIKFLMSACDGTIAGFLNIRCDTPNFSQPQGIVQHLGEYGNVGTQTADTVFPEHGYFSKLAYITGYCTGSDIEVEDPAPEIISMIAGLVVDLAYGADYRNGGRVDNVFAGYDVESGWTDNPVDLTVHVLTHHLHLPESRIATRATVRASAHTLGGIKDASNAERAVFPTSQVGHAGTDYHRYYSTGLIGPRSFFGTGLDFLSPGQRPGGVANREAEYEYSDTAISDVITRYRKRYTCNIELAEQKKAIDVIYDVLLPTFRGFLRWDQFGRIVVDSERPAEHTFLRAAAIPTDTSIEVWDVTHWAPFDTIINEPLPLRGKIRFGSTSNSEVRSVTSAVYSADGDSITLDADSSGGMTATPSGATLTGGSTSVPSSGSIILSGTVSPGDSITAIIDGYEVTIVATEDDADAAVHTLTMAEQLAYAINAEPGLQDYVEAGRISPIEGNGVGITSKLGVLNLSSALEENHYTEVADPVDVPIVTASAGSLAAGNYLVCYAYRNPNGLTNISPIASLALTSSQQIDVTAITPLPAGVDSVDWFVSVEANSAIMTLFANNDGSAFSINSLPLPTAPSPPVRNTTGEEIVRVMFSFAGKALTYADTTRANILDGTFEWPDGRRQSTINQVKTKYREAIQDFAEQPLVVNDERHQQQTGQVNTADIDLSAVDNYNTASRLCNGYLAKLRDADFFFSWGSGGEALLLEVGDVVCASDGSGEWRNVLIRIEDVGYDGRFEVSFNGRLYSTSQFDDRVQETQVPLPSALINYYGPPPDIEFNDADFPPDGLIQTTDGVGGITSIRGGAIFGASIYGGQYAKVSVKRPGESTFTEITRINPDSNLEAIFEFIASTAGVYTVQLEVCNQWGCNTTKPTASINIGLGAIQMEYFIPQIQLSLAGTAPSSGGFAYNLPPVGISLSGSAPSGGTLTFNIP